MEICQAEHILYWTETRDGRDRLKANQDAEHDVRTCTKNIRETARLRKMKHVMVRVHCIACHAFWIHVKLEAWVVQYICCLQDFSLTKLPRKYSSFHVSQLHNVTPLTWHSWSPVKLSLMTAGTTVVHNICVNLSGKFKGIVRNCPQGS